MDLGAWGCISTLTLHFADGQRHFEPPVPRVVRSPETILDKPSAGHEFAEIRHSDEKEGEPTFQGIAVHLLSSRRLDFSDGNRTSPRVRSSGVSSAYRYCQTGWSG